MKNYPIFIIVLFFNHLNACIEPEEVVLENMLKRNIQKNAEFTNRIAFNQHLWIVYENIVKKLHYLDDQNMPKECKKQENLPIDYENFQIFPCCPHTLRNITTNRISRYPRSVEYAMCLCTECLYQKESIHTRCVPVSYAKPVLFRGLCNSKGIYEYFFGYELVPIECKCKVKKNKEI